MRAINHRVCSLRLLRNTVLLVLLTIAITPRLYAQGEAINLNLVLQPPFSPHFEDYFEYEQKALLMATGVSNPQSGDYEVYFRGKLEGNNGILIQTRSDFKPGSPVIVPNGSTIMLSGSDLSPYFSVENLDVSGMEISQLLTGDGLPEGIYTLCMQAFDFYTDLPVSADYPAGCAGGLIIQHVEPPQIMSPVNGLTVPASEVQQVVISWNQPAGAPLHTRYTLTLAEVYEGILPEEAITGMFSPPIFDLTVDQTTYLYGLADPPLETGKTYALQVQAEDPTLQTVFRNDGKSAVISFTYGDSSGEEDDSTSGSGFFVTDLIGFPDVQLVPPTVIRGQILTRFPESQQTMSLSTGNPPGSSGSFSYQGIVSGGLLITGNAISNHLSMNQLPGFGYQNPVLEALLGQVYERGLLFESTQSTAQARPLPNMRLKLVARVAILDGAAGSGFPLYGKPVGALLAGARDVNGDLVYPELSVKYFDVVLDVCYTDQNGQYEFNFQAPYYTGELLFVVPDHPEEEAVLYEENPLGFLDWRIFEGEFNQFAQQLGNQFIGQSGGGMQTMSLQTNLGGLGSLRRGYLCLKIEVDHPKICSPDVDIFAMPGDVVSIPPQVALVKTYHLGVKTQAADKPAQLVEAGGPIAGARVKVMRDTARLGTEPGFILEGEGQQLDTYTFTTDGGFKNVAIDQTQADGRLLIRNLVYHYPAWDGPSPYLIEVSTRDFATVSTAYDNTLYNYQTILNQIPTQDFINESWYPSDHGVYNHMFSPRTLEITYVMEPLAPEIKGRVMAASNIENIGMKGARIDLFMQPTNKPLNSQADLPTSCCLPERTLFTPDNGFFRFEGLEVIPGPGGSPAGHYRRLYISKNGYQPVIIPPWDQYPYNLPHGQLKDIKDVMLEPAGTMQVYVADEEGNPVASYVRLKGGPWYKTRRIILIGNRPREVASIPVAHFANDIEIEPLSSQYFNETVHFNVVPQTSQLLTVYKKLHRPVFDIRNNQGQPVADCRIEVAGFTLETGSTGRDSLTFAAPENHFTVRILPSAGYAPRQLQEEIPVTRGYHTIQVTLTADKQISGTVRNKNTAEPVAGAVIYTELVSSEGQSLYLEARSDQQGRYTLAGIPQGTHQLRVHAGKAGNKPTYAGQVRELKLTTMQLFGQNPVYDFELEPLEGWSISSILGFPCIIESYQKLRTAQAQSGERIRVSGYFTALPGLGIFSEAAPDQRYPFSDLTLVKQPGQGIQPAGDEIVLDVMQIPVQAGPNFVGELFSPKTLTLPGGMQVIGTARGPLKIKKIMEGNQARGALLGALRLNLNSFRIAHDFNGDLFIGDRPDSYQVTAFGTIQHQTPEHYPVFDLSALWHPVPVRDFAVFGFEAEAILGESIIRNGLIRLRTNLHTRIPGGGTGQTLDLNLPAGELVISKDQISFQTIPAQKLQFQLEKWRVEAKASWYFDKNEEAVVIPEALILTGQGVDATVRGIRIKPDAIREGEVALQGGLNLGGIVPLKIAPGLSPLFNYDAGIGHYRISLIGESSGAAAWVENLPGLYNQRLEFTSIGLLSNQDQAISMQQVLRIEDLFELEADQIMTGNGFIKISGTPVTGIPGYQPVQAVLAFEKNNQKLRMKLEPLQGVVTCKGHVQFFLDQKAAAQTLVKGKYTSYGTVRVSPGNGMTGDPFELRGLLTKTNTSCRIDIIQTDPAGGYAGQTMQVLNLDGTRLFIESGEALASLSEWDYLRFTALTNNLEGIDQHPDNQINFTVYGAVKASSGNLRVNEISTPLGQMQLDYNFDEQSLTGTLNIQHANLGFARIQGGTMGVRFDSNGYYLAFTGQFALLEQGLGGGCVIGSSSAIRDEHLKPVLQGYRSGYIPDQLSQKRISGIYAIGKRSVIDKEIDVGITLSAKAEAGPYVNLDFSQGGEYTLGGYMWMQFKGGVETEVCDMGICSGAMIDIHGGLKNGSVFAEACGVQQFNVELCLVEVSGSIVTRAFYNNGIKFEMGLGGGCGQAQAGPCN